MGGRVTEKQSLIISIHALREEGDSMMEVQRNAKKYFYPRPPRGGRPFSEWLFSKSSIVFLSTPSARRATFSPHDDAPRPRNFYPRPPRGGRHVAVDLFSSSVEISIHALREEGDCTAPAGISIEWDFYPRPPRGGRRPSRRDRGSIYSISIHALREEGDPGYVQGRPAAFCISIHALREEGDLWMICFCWSMEISIHALREEGDLMATIWIFGVGKFLSTPSARRATNNPSTSCS